MTLAADTFIRANQANWGLASDGTDTWVKLGGSSPTLAIASNEGTYTNATASSTWALGTNTSTDQEILFRFKATATNDSVGVVLRSDATAANLYRAFVQNTTLTLGKLVAGVGTNLNTTPVTFTANTFYWIRFRVVGSSLYVRYWADGTTEPTTWNLTATDSTFASAGRFGTRISLGTITDTVSVDSLTLVTVYTLTEQTEAHYLTSLGLKSTTRDKFYTASALKTTTRAKFKNENNLTARNPLGSAYVPPEASDNHYVGVSGSHITYRGQNIKLYGCTIYLSTQGGIAAWKTDLTTVLDGLLLTMYQNGFNMVRITDYWDSTTVTQTFDEPQIWTNIDHIVTKCQQLGMFCMMDVSGYKAFLTSQGVDPLNAANWTAFLSFVGQHYANTAKSICWYNLSGEPALPVDQAGINSLAAFYGSLCDTVYAADNGTHLIEAGGLTHMNSTVAGMTSPAWWYPIYALTHNDVCGYKNYSVNDLVYMSSITSIMAAQGLVKPLSCNEFGAELEQGTPTFPAFSDSLGASIASGGTITSLTLQTAINSTVIAGTILRVGSPGNTENCVVATTTTSGTSIPVTSFVATFNHTISDPVTAIGFADTAHSLADTVDNYYKAVFGITTTILKWNGTPRTVVPTTVQGGDQSGTTSYVVWNLGYQATLTGYDVSPTNMPSAWNVLRLKALSDGYSPIRDHATTPPISRRTGVTPTISRRNGQVPAISRRHST